MVMVMFCPKLEDNFLLVVLVWLGSGTVRPRPRCSGLNKHVNFGVCLFLTGVREVPEPSGTSTAIGYTSILQ